MSQQQKPAACSGTAAIIGGGPAGLMAAEILGRAGLKVTIFERMPSLARKFLMAGRGGLNITHSEPLEKFIARYGAAADSLKPAINAFTPDMLRVWCEELGEETFVGSSGRVFPKRLKASPLLRAWLHRLDTLGVEVKFRHSFRGWNADGQMLIENNLGKLVTEKPDASILAMGGGSWPRLGSDGAWIEPLRQCGITVANLRSSNCGFDLHWSQVLREQFAGVPLKNVILKFGNLRAHGECTITDYGLEGGAIYALSASLRDAIEREGSAELHIDLKPDMSVDALAQRLASPRGKTSLSNHLRKRAALPAIEIALLRETNAPFDNAQKLADYIKSVPLKLLGVRPLDRAISSAGGVKLSELDANFMLAKLPGVFCAGEMIDWEAPTGGYLLQASLATGAAAAYGALDWLATR